MPKLEQYKQLQPFSLEELTDAANSLLRNKRFAQVNPRSIRYYISLGILPPPKGAPKVARYGYEHLARLLAAKALQDKGYKLEKVKDEIREMSERNRSRLEALAQSWLDDEEVSVVGARARLDELIETVKQAIPPTLASKMAYSRASGSVPSKQIMTDDFDSVAKIKLTPKSTLEVDSESDIQAELVEASKALQKLIQKINDST